MAARISFASFNLLNFQKVGESVHRGDPVTQADYDKKRDWIRGRVIELDADIIFFQELWAKSCLDDVLNVPELAAYKAVYLKDNWYNIAVAAVVRTPWRVKHKQVIKDFPFSNLTKIDAGDGEDDDYTIDIKRFSRSILRLRLEHTTSASTPEILVYGAHLKAKLPTKVYQVPGKHQNGVGSAVSTIRRTAEAAALRWILTDQMKRDNTPTVVIGDLNDDPRSNTLSILTEEPNMSPGARGGDTSLYSALQLKQLESFRDIYYTHEFRERKDALDHILVSKEFLAGATGRKWKLDGLKIWADFIDEHNKLKSDHGIIKASFR